MDTTNKNELAVTDRVFAGYLTDIPAKRSNEVRIFLSATLSDWNAERTWIMKTAVPQLRTFCQERGLDFQLIDVRWGVKDVIADDHSIIELGLHEIQNCQTNSIGPNFVALLGDKYGYRPLVPEIEASEFKLLKNTAIECGFDISLLTTWYLCDYNREPTVYVLQPISGLIPSFFDNNPMNSLLQQQAQREWFAVVDKLQLIFRKVTEVLHQKNRISEENKHKFFYSAVESEVTAGILKADDVLATTLCFQRTLNGISLEGGVRIAERYTDLVDKTLDYGAEQLREQLRLEKVRSVMPKENLVRYNLLWEKHGLDVAENPLHKSYLERFGQDFLSLTKTMILDGIQKVSAVYGNSPLLEEVLHHIHLCKSICDTFCGREMVLVEIRNQLRVVDQQNDIHAKTQENVKNDNESVSSKRPTSLRTIQSIGEVVQDDDFTGNGYEEPHHNTQSRETSKAGYNIKDESSARAEFRGDDTELDAALDIHNELNAISQAEKYTTPLIIYGLSGCGKTAISAKVMELSKFWFPGSVGIVRFLGTSHVTLSIREVLVSLCLQISHVYNITRPVGVDLNTSFQFLVNYLKTLLWRIDTAIRPLVIILDSVDQLTTADHAHTFNWLPVKLPPNVHLMVSVVTGGFDYMKQAKNIFPHPERYMEIPMMDKSSSLDMLNKICGKYGCHLAKKQTNILLDKFEKCGTVLYQKMLIDGAVTWKSYDKTEKDRIGSNVTGVINQIFDKLETDHSPVLVKRGLAFLCASRDGLTDNEIEDLLSLDNEVLQDTFVHHLPPDPDVIRVPQLLWKRIVYAIREYLLERHFGGQKVIIWHHKQFAETATSRYLVTGSENPIHQLMAEYFQGVWSSKPRLLHLTKGKRGVFPHAQRQVPAQPLMYSPNVYNNRMLHCLPYHLMHCGRFETLITELFTNPEWLYAKCLTLSLTSLMEDFRLAETTIATHIQSLRLAVSKSNSMVATGPKQKQEMADTKTELQDALDIFEAMKLITKAVLLSSEQIRRDPAYLPLHVIAQLGPGYKGLKHVERLVTRCVDWCKQFKSPLLLPLTDCLVKPGSNLLYTIDVDINVPGDWRVSDERYQRLFLQEETNKLFVTQPQLDKTDQICVFDIVDNGSCIRVVDVDKHVRSLRWTGNNKYLQLEEYTSQCAFHSRSDLFKSLTSSPVTFPGNHSHITVSATGRYLAYSSGCKVFVCYAKKDLPIYHDVEDHKRDVESIHISPDETFLLTTQQDPDNTEGSATLTSEGHTRSMIYDLTSKKLLHEVDHRLNITYSTLITKNNILVCPGSMDKSIVYCYDMTAGNVLQEVRLGNQPDVDVFQLHGSHQYALCGYRNVGVQDGVDDERSKVSKEGVADGRSNVSQVLRISDGTLHGTCPLYGSHASIMVFGMDCIYYAVCPMGDTILSIYYAGHVSHPLPKGILIHRLKGHREPILDILVPSAQDTIITASMDNIIKVWDLRIILSNFHSELTDIQKRLAAQSRLEPTPDQVVAQFSYKDTSKRSVTTQACLNMYGDSLYVGTDGGQLLRYCTETGALKMRRDISVDIVDTMFLSRNGRFVIAIGSRVHVEDLQSDVQLSLEFPCPVQCAAEANNVLVCASTGPDSRARVWNILTGQILTDITRPNSFECIAINRLGTKIVTSSQSLPIVVPLNGSQPVEPDTRFLDDGMTNVTCCDVNSRDSLAALGTDSGHVNVMSLKGKYVYRLRQRSQVATLTFSPDSKTLLTSGYRSIYVWCCDTGNLRYKLTRHQDLVTHLKFDPSGQFFVSFSCDKQLVLWDFTRLVSIATFHTQCKISGLDVADQAEMVVYIPEGVTDVAILKPNDALRNVMEGNFKPLTLEPKAQALALAFSSNGPIRSPACSVM